MVMYSHKRQSGRDPIVVQEPYSEREWILSEHQEIRDHLELRADHAAQGDTTTLSRLSVTKYVFLLLI